MKKLLLNAIISAIMFTSLSACSNSDIKKIGFHSYSDEIEQQIKNGELHTKVGEFDVSKFYFEITRNNGHVEKITLTEKNVNESDLFSFYKIGTSDVTFTYDNYFVKITSVVEINSFSDDISFKFNDTFDGEPCYTVEYDGEPHGLEVVGGLPQGTNVFYKYGNQFTQCSQKPYEIEATISKDGYEEKTIKGKLRIAPKAVKEEDLSGIVFEDKEFVYDGKEKKNEMSNVPKFLKVEYSVYQNGNKVTSVVNAGEYIVEGMLSCVDDRNNVIPNSLRKRTAKITITKKRIDTSSLSLSNISHVYDGKTPTIKVKGTAPENVSYDIADIVYKNSKGEVIQPPTEAGIYTYSLKLLSSTNYELVPEELIATITISKKIIEIKNIIYKNETKKYTGEKIEYTYIDEQIPEEYKELLKVEKTYYSSSGSIVEPIEPGYYSVFVSFVSLNENIEFHINSGINPLLIIEKGE